MYGVDLGLNVASVTEIRGKTVMYSLVFKFTREKELPKTQRTIKCAQRIVNMIKGNSDGNPAYVALEEPIYSWGRRNPKAFSKSVELFCLVNYMLFVSGYKVIPINNKTAKKLAGSGSKDKEEMIQAFKRETGKLPGHSAKYGQETLADSYFIGRAGLQYLKEKKDASKKA